MSMGKRNRVLVLVGILLLLVLLVAGACKGAQGEQGSKGDTGATGAAGAAGAAGPAGPAGADAPVVSEVQPESCVICHSGAGDNHQASYDEMYQDGVIAVTDLNYANDGTNDTVTFKMTKASANFDCRDADSIGIYFTAYTGSSFEQAARLSLASGAKKSYDGAGVCKYTKAQSTTGDLSKINGVLVVYGRDETIGTMPNTRVTQNKYPFAAVLETGAGVDYVSAANNAGCEKCHTVPFLKHSYIYGQVNNDPATDFYTCKGCHLDNGNGGHQDWQILVDNPARYAEISAGIAMTDAEKVQYAYKTRLMNDVHMSHAMEFPYPQSMANCVTCHEGKLGMILTDANFEIETCKSCHAVTGSEEHPISSPRPPALKTVLPPLHDGMDLNTIQCNSCHKAGGIAPVFSKIHIGYNKLIYYAEGQKYSDAITVAIDSASITGNTITIGISAAGTAGSLDAANIVPEVMIGLYGYDTKDFVVNGHDRYDSSGNGVISRADGDLPKGAYEVGTEHAYFKTVAEASGAWTVTTDLTEWADMIADGTIKRVEIAILPMLDNADGEEVALNAPSRTFNLAANAFDDDFYSPIVKVAGGCNNCHEALATTFHTPDRGGNIVVCRMCHVVLAGGSHLEMQSRSIDSYVHAIHSFQDFDIGDIDFADPVEAVHYEHHIHFPYPNHGITNCESCHVKGTYNVPDQTKSLPGVLSRSDTVKSMDRNIGTVPSYITGPASRACGACHRAELINHDDASKLASFFQHTKAGGYLIEGGKIDEVIKEIMAKFD